MASQAESTDTEEAGVYYGIEGIHKFALQLHEGIKNAANHMSAERQVELETIVERLEKTLKDVKDGKLDLVQNKSTAIIQNALNFQSVDNGQRMHNVLIQLQSQECLLINSFNKFADAYSYKQYQINLKHLVKAAKAILDPSLFSVFQATVDALSGTADVVAYEQHSTLNGNKRFYLFRDPQNSKDGSEMKAVVFMFSLNFNSAGKHIDVLAWRKGEGHVNVDMYSGEIVILDLQRLKTSAPAARRSAMLEKTIQKHSSCCVIC